ncbi:MAG: riboflavin synthase [Phascolarctobacterium sp.]|uniref:riboflavin synthase n=1 Tax=Phascolarctobacterium sp. TaxID=2049039 RepID=UPI0026DAECC7|nr:riboflavin synthase [Phascolarctobacterium sp.]MDO4921377.1 riboflavin synthase [Phascolarctobacterium sp.]
MFTGLVAELGTVQNLARQGESYHLTVSAAKVMQNLKIGDSVAVNGACLTVVRLDGGAFTADVMPETVRLTNIGQLRTGDKVNLERTLRLCDGLDGHIVSGHVEGQGVIAGRRPEGIAMVVNISAPPELLKYIIKKGSVAIDGISLTVTQITDTDFSVSLIPHTAKETTLGFKDVGDKVNLETDIIGKYVERMLSWDKKQDGAALLDKNTLLANGFM